jgi:uncharacterized membrane protein
MNDDNENYTFGDKVSDAVARFGGSWAAIISCTSIIVVWIFLNTWLLKAPLDPFPYILLNLVLSCIAALQAPFILMANARQEIKDRKKLDEDIAIDRKAEEEIREVLNKLDLMHKDVQGLLDKAEKNSNLDIAK